MMDLLQPLLDMIGLDRLVLLMATLTAVMAVAFTWNAAVPKSSAAARARSLGERRRAMKADSLAGYQPGGRAARLRAESFMRRVVTRLNLMRSTQADKMRMTLARAGWRSQQAMITYLFMKLVAPLAIGAVAALLIYGLNVLDLPTLAKSGAALGATLVGAYLPDLIVRNAAAKREDKLRKSLPDGLDMLVICAEAGLSMDSSLSRVADEMGDALPELADEFSLTALELGFLPDRRKALDNLASRVDQPGIRGLVNTFIQTEQYGTPLAQALRVLSRELRTERMLKAEEKAARLPAVMTMPMVLFILPPLIIVLLGPAGLRTADALF